MPNYFNITPQTRLVSSTWCQGNLVILQLTKDNVVELSTVSNAHRNHLQYKADNTGLNKVKCH